MEDDDDGLVKSAPKMRRVFPCLPEIRRIGCGGWAVKVPCRSLKLSCCCAETDQQIDAVSVCRVSGIRMASWLKIGRFDIWPGMGSSCWKRGMKVFLKRVCASGTDADGSKLSRYFVE